MGSPYILRVSSQKGGVGKTTIAVNLAVALQEKEYETLLFDGDFINPSVGYHLGMEKTNVGLRSLLLGRTSLQETTVIHAPTGLHVVPGEIRIKPYSPTNEQLMRSMNQLRKSRYDFIVIDTPPGYYPTEILPYYTEAMIIATPEMSSCVSAVRQAELYARSHLAHRLVANRIRNRRYELHISEMEDVYGDRVFSQLPEDDIVPVSVAEHIPAYILNRRAPFSKGINDLARRYGSKVEVGERGEEERPRRSFWQKLFWWRG